MFRVPLVEELFAFVGEYVRRYLYVVAGEFFEGLVADWELVEACGFGVLYRGPVNDFFDSRPVYCAVAHGAGFGCRVDHAV